MRQALSAIAVLAAALIFSLATVTTADAARECHSEKLQVVSTDATKFPISSRKAAKNLADQAWVSQCTKLFGNTFCDITKAKRGRHTCERQPGETSRFAHTCAFAAYPCRDK